jgi:8-oxo-dGTP pyrophosphatase MutT (NUDIX family)
VPLVELRAAAVLVTLVDRPEGFTILLTRRTAHLSRHAGQIAFPGGRVDEVDADEVATALRETEEEIGLSRDYIEPVGMLDRYVTRTGFTVTPIVALVQPPFSLSIDPNEVDEAFEVPLAFILDPANQKRDSYDFQGVARHFYVFDYGERRIWGATAGMLINLAEIFNA